MIDSLFTLYCEDCEVAGRPSRLWVRAEIEVSTTRGPETQHYLECMNCGYRFKSCMEDHMEDRLRVLLSVMQPHAAGGFFWV